MVLFLGFVLSAFAQVSVTVVEPIELRKILPNEGNLVSGLASYGDPPYGSTISGRLYKYKEDFCFGCSDLRPLKFDDEKDEFSHPILILDKGDCEMKIKSLNAQLIGIHALIIINNVKEVNVSDIMKPSISLDCKITIPTILISKEDGLTIKDFIKENPRNRVKIRLSFEAQNYVNEVKYEFWMHPNYYETHLFLKDFSKHAKNISSYASFTPHYTIGKSIESQVRGYVTKIRDCLGAGRYCASNPGYQGIYTGADVLFEVLWEICIFNQTYKTGMNGENLTNPWWDYVERLDFGKLFDNMHSQNITKIIGIDRLRIEQCIENSVIGDGITVNDIILDPNWVLDSEQELMKERKLTSIPAFIVNGQFYRGNLNSNTVIRMICSQFREKPEYCLQFFN